MNTLKFKLLGLSRACDNNEHMYTEETFRLIRDIIDRSEPDDVLLGRIAAEKYRIAPMCADCASPCGRTADPDESIFGDKEMLAIDLELLERLLRCGLAYYGQEELHRLLIHAKALYK